MNVILPVEPTREMLSALAGHPALLAASVEESAREAYAALLSAAPLAATEWEKVQTLERDSAVIMQSCRSVTKAMDDDLYQFVLPPLPGKEAANG